MEKTLTQMADEVVDTMMEDFDEQVMEALAPVIEGADDVDSVALFELIKLRLIREIKSIKYFDIFADETF